MYELMVQSVTMWWSKELQCSTKYYSNTTLYYKVLRQYYQYWPVLLCTTKRYSGTTLY